MNMRNRIFTGGTAVAVAALAVILPTAGVAQQDKSKRPSPPAAAEVTLKGKKITIDYSRPSLRGRKVGTDLAPYGKVWRVGANEATTLTTAANLDIGGVKVPAGTYTLYALPAESGWKLIINKQTGQWGTEYHQEQDLARVDMKTSALPQQVEQFTISFDKKGDDTASLQLDWENTRVSVTVKAE
jgi:hypothetical protein